MFHLVVDASKCLSLCFVEDGFDAICVLSDNFICVMRKEIEQLFSHMIKLVIEARCKGAYVFLMSKLKHISLVQLL